MTYQGFLDKYRVKMDATLIDERPDGHMGDMPAGSLHWRCVLRCSARRMTVYFSQGPAISREPTAADVLDCLASDVSGYENAPNFEEWAQEYGYDPDSRKAEGIYRTIERQREGLMRLLPADAYTTLLWKMERL